VYDSNPITSFGLPGKKKRKGQGGAGADGKENRQRPGGAPRSEKKKRVRRGRDRKKGGEKGQCTIGTRKKKEENKRKKKKKNVVKVCWAQPIAAGRRDLWEKGTSRAREKREKIGLWRSTRGGATGGELESRCPKKEERKTSLIRRGTL